MVGASLVLEIAEEFQNPKDGEKAWPQVFCREIRKLSTSRLTIRLMFGFKTVQGEVYDKWT